MKNKKKDLVFRDARIRKGTIRMCTWMCGNTGNSVFLTDVVNFPCGFVTNEYICISETDGVREKCRRAKLSEKTHRESRKTFDRQQ